MLIIYICFFKQRSTLLNHHKIITGRHVRLISLSFSLFLLIPSPETVRIKWLLNRYFLKELALLGFRDDASKRIVHFDSTANAATSHGQQSLDQFVQFRPTGALFMLRWHDHSGHRHRTQLLLWMRWSHPRPISAQGQSELAVACAVS